MLNINVCFRHPCCNTFCHLQTLCLNRSCLYYKTLIKVTGNKQGCTSYSKRIMDRLASDQLLMRSGSERWAVCSGSILGNLEFGSFEPELVVGVDSNQIPDVELRTWQFQVYLNNTKE